MEDLTVPHLALVTVLMNWLNSGLEKVAHLVHLSVTNLEMPKAVYQLARLASKEREKFVSESIYENELWVS